MALQLCHAIKTCEDQLPKDFCTLLLVAQTAIRLYQNYYTWKKDMQENNKIAM